MVYVRGREGEPTTIMKRERMRMRSRQTKNIYIFTKRGWGLGVYIRIELVYIHVYNGACLNLWITYLKTISSILFNPK